MKIKLILVGIGLLSLSIHAEMRIWTSKKGQTIEAEYQRDASGKVWLKPQHGKTKIVPIAALSEKDQIFIQMKSPPKIEIEVDDDVDRGTVGSDIDNVREELSCKITINKISKAPYPMEYEAHFFLFGLDIRYKEYVIRDKFSEKFTLDDSNGNTVTFESSLEYFEHDPDPAWGQQYDGYLIVVEDREDNVVCRKGKDRYFSNFSVLKEVNKGNRLNKKFVKVERRSRY